MESGQTAAKVRLGGNIKNNSEIHNSFLVRGVSETESGHNPIKNMPQI